METIINKDVKKDPIESPEKTLTKETLDDAAFAITDITIEEVSIDGICGVY